MTHIHTLTMSVESEERRAVLCSTGGKLIEGGGVDGGERSLTHEHWRKGTRERWTCRR